MIGIVIMASTSDLKKGIVIRFKDGLYVVTEFQHVNPGKGSAFTRVRLKNVATGRALENTFKAVESVEIVEVEHKNMQYLFSDGQFYNFMDNSTYEQTQIGVDVLGDDIKFLKEGLEVMALFYEGSPVAVELPRKIAYKVTEAPPAVKGDTAGGNVTKEVVLENGLKTQVPIFIKEGEMIVVNTDTGEYVERQN